MNQQPGGGRGAGPARGRGEAVEPKLGGARRAGECELVKEGEVGIRGA